MAGEVVAGFVVAAIAMADMVETRCERGGSPTGTRKASAQGKCPARAPNHQENEQVKWCEPCLLSGTPRPKLLKVMCMAGLLAHGSSPCASLPGSIPVARGGAGLADYSCGGSFGIRAKACHRIPFSCLPVRADNHEQCGSLAIAYEAVKPGCQTGLSNAATVNAYRPATCPPSTL